MENNSSLPQPKNKISWVVYATLILTYISPIFMYNIMGMFGGLFTFSEYVVVAKNPLSILFFLVILATSNFSCIIISKTAKAYYSGKVDYITVGKRLKKLSKLNIVGPILAGVLQGATVCAILATGRGTFKSFEGNSPYLSIAFFSLSVVFNYALLFYVINIKIFEKQISDIPMSKESITMSITERQFLAILFAVLGVLAFFIAMILCPGNLSQGSKHLAKIVFSYSAYVIVFFVIVEYSIVSDIKNCVSAIERIASSLANKDYLINDEAAVNRSELGIVIQDMNLLKKITSELLSEIEHSTKNTSRQSDDLVANMDLTKRNVSNIAQAISSVKEKMVQQAMGVSESSASTDQILASIQELNKAISSQASGVTESSAAVEEMVANIRSVTEILGKNNIAVTKLARAAEKGKNQIITTVQTAENVHRESEGILEAASIIQTIANQTNLLAMNAAIESAHAGESGKGFAVVADEIRKLAEQSEEQSKAIGSNLKNLSDSITKITSDIRLVQTEFEDIYKLSQSVKQQEDVISNAMEEQSSGNQQVLEAMKEINNSTSIIHTDSSNMMDGGNRIVEEMKTLKGITDSINANMKQIEDFSQRISDAVTVTTSSTIQTKESLGKVMKGISEFKLS